ncbi:hypothetical protein ACFVRD_40455 [Streptomyces sp. NPDC057908]|uniref:hypothetical protein n=1 Tax=Streptomyces sp. NPDC057908 TaxID=3346276 RepID=UPI0036EC45FE
MRKRIGSYPRVRVEGGGQAVVSQVGGTSRKQLTPDLVADFGTLLGIPADDLAALTGITLSEEPHTQEPAAADMAELLWDLRRLTADQVRHASEAAVSMRST